MAADLATILQLDVPLIVRLAERSMSVREVVALTPGALIELPKAAEAELDLLINNVQIGTGTAVKIGENYGIRITFVGDVRDRVVALGGTGTGGDDVSLDDAELLAAQLLG